MRIHCPQCKSQYNVDEKRIPPQGVQIKCPKCLNAFVVQAPTGEATQAVPLPGGGGGGAVPLPGGGGGGAVPLPGGGGGGAVPLPGGGGAVPLPGGGGGGAIPLPGGGGGGAVPLPGGGGGGAVPLPGGGARGGAVPLPGGGFGGAVPLPGGGGGGAVPLPGMGGGGAVPLPGGGMGGAVPLPGGGFGGGVPLPGGGGGGAVPLPGMPGAGPVPLPGMPGGGMPMPGGFKSSGMGDMDAGAPPSGPTVDSVVQHPFHGQTQARPAPTRAPAPAPTIALDGGVLDFIDRAAEQAPNKPVAQYRIRKRSGKVVGPADEQSVLRMLRSHELLGSEEASEDGVTWKPLSQFPAFAAEIQQLMASALGSLADLPAPAQGDLPAPVNRDLPAPVNRDLPAPVTRGKTNIPAPQGGASDDPFANLSLDLPTPATNRDLPAPVPGGFPDGMGDPGALPADVAKAAGGRRKAAVKEKGGFPVGLAVGVGLALLLLATGVVTEFVTPELGAFGRKKLFAPPPPPPPPPKTNTPKPVVTAPTWHGTSVEAYLAEDNLVSYQQAQKSLKPELDSNPGVAVALAQAQALPAYFDAQAALVAEAASTVEKAKAVDERAGEAFRVFVLLAQDKADDALKAAAALAGEMLVPFMKDEKETVRARESWVQTSMGWAILHKGGKPADAIQRFDWALTAMPSNVVATVGQARAVLAGGDETTAIGYLERAIQMQPDNLRARLLLGRILLKSGKTRGAMENFQHAAASAGAKGTPQQRAEAHAGVSDAAFQDRDFKLALEEIKNAVAEVPEDSDMRLRYGELALKLRDWPLARQIYDDLLTQKPGLEGAIIGSARAKLGATDGLNAYRQIQDGVTAKPTSWALNYWFGVASEALGKMPEAIALYKKSESLDPKRAAPVVAQARLLINERKYVEALKLLEPARGRVAPEEDHLLRAAMAEILLRQRQLPLAKGAFEEVLKSAPWNSEARALYGRTLKEMKKLDEAQKQLKQALSEDPKNALILAEMGSYFEGTGQYERAVDLYQEALAVAPKEADYHVRMGAALFRGGKLSEAQEHLKAGQTLSPSNPDFHYWMALAVRDADPEQAKTLLKRGLEISPEDTRFDHELARSVSREGAIMEATDYLRSAVRKDPKNGEAYFELGKFLAEQQRYSDARDQLERALEIFRADNRDTGPVYMVIAHTYARTGQYDEARKGYAAAIKASPNLPDGHCAMADVLRQDNKCKLAIAEYRSCVRLAPRHKDAWHELGACYLQLPGKASKQDAIDALKQHLKVNPDSPMRMDTEDLLEQAYEK